MPIFWLVPEGPSGYFKKFDVDKLLPNNLCMTLLGVLPFTTFRWSFLNIIYFNIVVDYKLDWGPWQALPRTLLGSRSGSGKPFGAFDTELGTFRLSPT